jgi:1-deoxy-D-xylulose-5-phosphate reductoisomerase
LKRRVVILGCTGSIGENALRVAEALPGVIEIVGLAVRTSWSRALETAVRLGVRELAVEDPAAARACAAAAPAGIRVRSGQEGLVGLATLEGVDLVLCAVVGMAGFQPVLAAVSRGISVALATKEVLVGGGEIVTEACRRTGARLLPVDSEHSAIFQCLAGAQPRDVGKLILTASGGPFAFRPEVDFERITVEEALNHPRWRMGRKVTIDSATLMNKGLELIEARWLFDMPLSRMEVVLHPESLVHSLVQFVDGSLLAQMGPPDMRFAIQYALTWPQRMDGGLQPLELGKLGALHFTSPSPSAFRVSAWRARRAGRAAPCRP